MKKLLLIITLMFGALMSYGQYCPNPQYGGTYTLMLSSTHPSYTKDVVGDGWSPSQYIFTPTIPNGTGRSYMGLFRNEYRIKIPTGNESFTYKWHSHLHLPQNPQIFAARWEVMLARSSNGQPSTVIVDNSYYTTDGTQPTSTSLHDETVSDGTEFSFTIPPNPYTDRTLVWAVQLNLIKQYTAGCPTWFPYPVEYGAETNPNDGHSRVGFFDAPWVEIKQPPKTFPPTSITGLHAWWKWKTNVTVVSNTVSSWNDQSGNGYHMIQNTAANRPAYDAVSGALSGDGINDFLQAASAINQSGGEVTAVIELPSNFSGQKTVFGKNTSTTADGDALNLFVNSGKKLQKDINVGNGSVASANEVLPTNTKVIVSWSFNGAGGSLNKFWINGVECTYLLSSGGGWLISGNNTFMTLFKTARPLSPSYSNIKIYDVSYYNHELTAAERATVTTYYKVVFGMD